MSLYAAILRTVLREARAKGWRPIHLHLRRACRLYEWTDAEQRIVVRVGPSPTVGYGMMQLTVRQHMYCGWVDIDVSQVGTWECVLDILATRFIVDPKHAAAWRRGQSAATDTIPRGAGPSAERFLAELGVAPDAGPVTFLPLFVSICGTTCTRRTRRTFSAESRSTNKETHNHGLPLPLL